MTDRSFAVIKVGGSILREEASYRSGARRLAEEFARGPTWAVVSAGRGITDALERLCRRGDAREVQSFLHREAEVTGVRPTPLLEADLWRGLHAARCGVRDRLLAWGERASAEALRVHLSEAGAEVPLVELSTAPPTHVRRAAIVPGFYVRDRGGRIRCLPRGGSDISAVLVAAQLHARQVRFWKEGGGVRAYGEIVPEIEASVLLPRLSRTIRPLQPAAVLLASRRGIDLVLEDPFGRHAPTRIVSRAVDRSDGLRPPPPPELGRRVPVSSPLAVVGDPR
ncbi:MAG TPA: hypothetical protein VGR51_06750 [Thermoplasmata archaeon]|jgi:aspartokinase|nr:hypothetical protein [Thermoplasmata archaeon]